MAKVYIFLADGYEEIEGLTVVDLLRRAEIDITMVSVTGCIQVTGSHQITTVADDLYEDIDFNDADMLVLPGGPGIMTLLKHKGLDQLLKDFHSKNKNIAAICAAPRVLGEKGLLQGKSATCYPGVEITLQGATYDSDMTVVTDGNITTSKGLGTAIDFSLAIIKTFKGEAEAEKIAKAIQYSHYSRV